MAHVYTPCIDLHGLGEQHLCKVMYNNYRNIGVQLQLDDRFFGVHVCLCMCIMAFMHTL